MIIARRGKHAKATDNAKGITGGFLSGSNSDSDMNFRAVMISTNIETFKRGYNAEK